ncbi:DUF6949 family protein [Aestuariivirga sp.]|uniref:DUF6949 family protein n=1 Tax=Aestuariivirga sp. TaxID=2650926 RepID=UPI0039E51181
MQLYVYAYILAGLTGLVSAGLVGSGWALVSGERPNFRMMARFDVLTPLKTFALCAYAPLGVLRTGLWYFDFNPFVALLMLVLGLGWSFLQGVFILTTFLGYS